MTILTALPPLAGLTLKAPAGADWDFLVLFLVVILGPPLIQRARLPGIIGLLIGGFVIGPNGLNLIGSGNMTVPEVGQLGLLYLMFVAGLELDLALVRVHRRAVLIFGTLAFAVPMALGSAIGFAMHWEVAAALLLGSLMASHTLLVYPDVRNAGLASHRAVATAVGATVLTDTASLIVLAFVSGSQVDGGSLESISVQVLFGLVVLIIFSLVILPRLVRLGFRYLGTDRIVRYLLAFAGFLAAATLGDVLGIEGIVGAFFAGLGLNRLVPNEGPLMDRIDFFGSAVFVPIFLITVGMLLQPSVMIQAQTLKLAGLFIAAAVGGKIVATAISSRTLHLSVREGMLMFGLTIPQAAATLASTVIGFNIGLFDQSVVNAVLVLILVSILLATLIVQRVKGEVPRPHTDTPRLGQRVLVALENSSQAQTGFAVAARLAARDGGLVRGVLRCPPLEKAQRAGGLSDIARVAFALGVDANPTLLLHRSYTEGILNAAAELEPSIILVGESGPLDARSTAADGRTLAASSMTPIALILGRAPLIKDVILITGGVAGDGAPGEVAELAAQIAARVGGRRLRRCEPSQAPSETELEPGTVIVIPEELWPLDGSRTFRADGVVVILVFEPLVSGREGELSALLLGPR